MELRPIRNETDYQEAIKEIELLFNVALIHCQSVLPMTELVEQAIARLKTLSSNEQDAIASMILEELEDDLHWDEAFSRSPNTLAKLAAIAMAEYHAGKTQELDPETQR